MINIKKLCGIYLLLIGNFSFGQDVAGCTDPSLFLDRVTNYAITKCTNNFDAVEFNLAPLREKMITQEGAKTSIRYEFISTTGKKKSSYFKILRHYENEAQKSGGITMFLSTSEGIGVFKISKDNKEIAWVKVECGGNDSANFYVLTIVELQLVKNEINSNDLLNALNNNRHIILYFSFENGIAAIMPESQKVIDLIAEILKANTSIRLSIEGHSDNEGTPEQNKVLSENNAKVVMNSLIANGVDESRFSIIGWGQDKPISDNSSEGGKAKNRRVEIVKL